MTYTKEDKKIIKTLKDAEVELTGEESSEELATLLAAQEIKDAEEETPSVAEEVEGIPNRLPVKTEEIELGGKKYQIGVFFMATVKGGKQAMYNYMGQRVSPAYGPEDLLPGSENSSSPTKALSYINKACAKFNSQRRKSMLPGDFL